MPNRPAPPPPKKAVAVLKVVRAIYPYTATRSDEVSFAEGDQLYILSEPEVGWFMARVGHPERGQSGLVPANYVEENTEQLENPLHEAAKRGNVAFLRDCLANKMSPNGLDHAGCTPLHWAAAGGHLECMDALLNCGRNVVLDVQNKLGDTPLHQAAWKGQTEAVERLIGAGARTDLKNKDKLTPFDLAREAQTQALLRRASSGRIVVDSSDYIDEDAAEDSD